MLELLYFKISHLKISAMVAELNLKHRTFVKSKTLSNPKNSIRKLKYFCEVHAYFFVPKSIDLFDDTLDKYN